MKKQQAFDNNFSKNNCSMKEPYAQRSKNSEAVYFKNICK